MKLFMTQALILIFALSMTQCSDQSSRLTADQKEQVKEYRVNIADIRYTQDSIRPTFTSTGTNIKAVIDRINHKELTVDDFKKLKVIRLKPKNPTADPIYFSLDNRTLYAFKNSILANEDVIVVSATPEEMTSQIYKLTSQDDGFTIRVTSEAKQVLDPPPHTVLYRVKKMIEEHSCQP